MSGLDVNTPDFVPGGPSSDAPAPAPAPVNPFLKVAAKEFVPSAPAFVPSGGFGSTFPTFVPSFTPAAPAFVPPSYMQQRSAVAKEGDDMSLSEVQLPIMLQFFVECRAGMRFSFAFAFVLHVFCIAWSTSP
jgi:hypothetical protein